MVAPSIIKVYPANGSAGIPLGDHIKVTFNQEMDESSINSGTFVLIGPEVVSIFGDDLNPLDDLGPETEEILTSPYLGASVKGKVSFLRVDENDDPIDDSVKDYTGDGSLWRTVAIFIPNIPLSPNKEYSVIVAGDEAPSNEFKSGVKSRTVFDTKQEDVSGTGTMEFVGGFVGETPKKYFVQITGAGSTGNATYEWWEETDPLTVLFGVTSTGERILESGVSVFFGPDGLFEIGDKWSVVCKPLQLMPDYYEWTFNTGSGSIVIPSSDYSSSGIELPDNSLSELKIISIKPKDATTNLDPEDVHEIVIEFNKIIDPTTVNNSTIKLWSESVNGDKKFIASGDLAKIISVSGNKITLQI